MPQKSRNYLIPYNQQVDEDPIFAEYTYGHEFDLQKVEKGEYIFFHTKILDERYITAYYEVFDKKSVVEIQKDPSIVSKYQNPHIRSGNGTDIVIFGHPVYSHILQKPVRLTKEIRNKLVGDKSIDRPLKVIMSSDAKDYLLEEIQKQQKVPLQDVSLTTNDVYHLRESDIENFIQIKPQILGESFTFSEKQKVLRDKTRLDLLLKDKKGLVVVEIKKGLIGPEVYEQIKGYISKVKEYIAKGKIEVYVHAWKFDLKKIDAVDVTLISR
jgi:hypothetical protein